MRARDGGVQRLGSRVVSRAARKSPRGDVAINILYGAAVLTRARIASVQGVACLAGVPRLTPLELTEIENRLFLS